VECRRESCRGTIQPHPLNLSEDKSSDPIIDMCSIQRHALLVLDYFDLWKVSCTRPRASPSTAAVPENETSSFSGRLERRLKPAGI
jgi:hypothetical protein